MTKAAVEAMTRTLAKDCAPKGVTVNVVVFGLVDTDMNAAWLRASDESRAMAAAASAFNRIGTPADVADVVAFVASEEARLGSPARYSTRPVGRSYECQIG